MHINKNCTLISVCIFLLHLLQLSMKGQTKINLFLEKGDKTCMNPVQQRSSFQCRVCEAMMTWHML